jgi:hypothetical protein
MGAIELGSKVVHHIGNRVAIRDTALDKPRGSSQREREPWKPLPCGRERGKEGGERREKEREGELISSGQVEPVKPIIEVN